MKGHFLGFVLNILFPLNFVLNILIMKKFRIVYEVRGLLAPGNLDPLLLYRLCALVELFWKQNA